MADSPTARKLTRPAGSFARRYGLAFASVAGALLLDLLFRHFNLPHPFAAFALSAIAITFWYGGTKPGIVAVLLASLIRGFIVEGETSSLSRVLYELGESDVRASTRAQSLLASWTNVIAGGTPELVLVSRYSGIGKASVVTEFHKLLVKLSIGE
jgi:hypothetical protein